VEAAIGLELGWEILPVVAAILLLSEGYGHRTSPYFVFIF